MDQRTHRELERHLRLFLRACARARAKRRADGLVAILRRLPDPEMRAALFAEGLTAESPEAAADLLAIIWAAVQAGDPRHQAVFLDLCDLQRLGRYLGPEALGRIRTALAARGEGGALLIFSEAGPAASPEGADPEDRPRPKEPVGMRISLARRPSPRLLDHLIYDPDVRVARTLLGNPRLTEPDVLKMASARRATARILEAIAQDTRWLNRYSVKLALVFNPNTPVRIAVGLLPFLLSQHLREVAEAAAVGPTIRRKARDLLKRRGRPDLAPAGDEAAPGTQSARGGRE